MVKNASQNISQYLIMQMSRCMKIRESLSSKALKHNVVQACFELSSNSMGNIGFYMMAIAKALSVIQSYIALRS